jgi:hypothetical protein
MALRAVKSWMERFSRPVGPESMFLLLRRTPYAELDETVRMLVRNGPIEDVRKAMVELIKEAPLQDFRILKRVYFKHFAG